MPIRKVGGITTSLTGSSNSGTTKIKRVTVGRPVTRVQSASEIKTFDGLGDIPNISELKLGELGINTVDGKLYLKKSYDNGIETVVEVGAHTLADELSASTTFNSYIYTSDGTLLVISGEDDLGNSLTYDPNPDSPSRIQIYLNGVLLQPDDYTADNGTSITLTTSVDAEQVVQVAAYNSTGISFGNDIILDDHFSFTVGTNEETRFYHNGIDTSIKHMGFDNSKFKIQYLSDDKFVMDDSGVQLLGHYTLNSETIATQSDLDQISTRLDSLDSDVQEIKSILVGLLQN
jgi:hypothetical protein|tara:strand:+ start:568 stop:1434 length:867 start_codon:yes stop_codon:yes gene_type:complete